MFNGVKPVLVNRHDNVVTWLAGSHSAFDENTADGVACGGATVVVGPTVVVDATVVVGAGVVAGGVSTVVGSAVVVVGTAVVGGSGGGAGREADAACDIKVIAATDASAANTRSPTLRPPTAGVRRGS